MACTVLGLCRNSGKCGSIQPLSADPRLGISDSIESKNRAFPALLCQDTNKTPGFQKGQNGKNDYWPSGLGCKKDVSKASKTLDLPAMRRA